MDRLNASEDTVSSSDHASGQASAQPSVPAAGALRKALPERKRIALIAHDHKKSDLLAWAQRNRAHLERHELYATGTTGSLLSEALRIPVRCFESGPLGGDLQIGSHITEGKMDVMFFFWDPLEAQPHDPDVRALLRVAVVWNIPLACNVASADFILSSPLFGSAYERSLDDYSDYKDRLKKTAKR